MIPFAKLGYTPDVQTAFHTAARECTRADVPPVPGRVVSLDRGFPLVRTPEAQRRAELAACLKKSDDSIVAVGDWVVLCEPAGHEKAVIERVLPRRTELARVKRVGRERVTRRQVLAANVDTVLICQSLTGEGPDFRLLIRQMAAVAGCGARPVFVFTKRDAVERAQLDEWLGQVHGFAPDVTVLVTAQDDAASIAAVRACCAPETTAMLLGESGVGKSSLVNALVGSDVLDVGDVRAADDKGRHTTVARRMVDVPDGGVIIDAPGLRTLQLLDVEACARAAFPDVLEAAGSCRFRDCAHEEEPGCAVRERIAPPRLAAYRFLLANVR